MAKPFYDRALLSGQKPKLNSASFRAVMQKRLSNNFNFIKGIKAARNEMMNNH